MSEENKQESVLDSLIHDINSLLKDEPANVTKSEAIQLEQDQVKKVDNLQDIETHRQTINNEIVEEFKFKKQARMASIIVFLNLSFLLVINLLLILYWNPAKLDYKVIIVLITATFANIFAIVTLVFKYIFSPTKDMLDYNSNLNMPNYENNEFNEELRRRI